VRGWIARGPRARGSSRPSGRWSKQQDAPNIARG
jgi:hypothetical protein